MKMLIAGEWVGALKTIPVLNPFDGSEVDTIPRGTADDANVAFAYAVEGAAQMRKTSGHDRYLWLMKAAELMEERSEDLARTITLEEGKPLSESRGEVMRSRETIIGSAEEAKRLGSEVVPLLIEALVEVEAAAETEHAVDVRIRDQRGRVIALVPKEHREALEGIRSLREERLQSLDAVHRGCDARHQRRDRGPRARRRAVGVLEQHALGEEVLD